MQELLIRIFCDVDEFEKAYTDYCQKHLITTTEERKILIPRTKMSLSEIMTIVIFFHLSNYRNFKHYYNRYVCGQLSKYFPNQLSYNR